MVLLILQHILHTEYSVELFGAMGFCCGFCCFGLACVCVLGFGFVLDFFCLFLKKCSYQDNLELKMEGRGACYLRTIELGFGVFFNFAS